LKQQRIGKEEIPMERKRSLYRFAALFLASIALAACGGNGDLTAPPPSSTVITKVAALDNAQETTGSISAGKGGGVLTVDTATRKASGFVASTGVPGTAAHIHSAARGVAGGIIVPLVGGPDIWVVPDNTTLSAANVTDFQNGTLYFNIHSETFPGGEIRGQIDMTPTALKFAALDNTQETTGSNSTGKGGGLLAVDTATGKIAGFAVSEGVPGTASHIHSAARGVAGGIIVPLVGGPSHWFVPDNTTLSAANVTGFQNGTLYYNIHSVAFPGGEIRGQIDMTPTRIRLASLHNTQETTGSNSTAKGGGVLAVDTATGKAAGFSVSAGVPGTASHIHSAARGVAGGIILPLVGGPSHWFVPDNATLSAANVTDFQNGTLYYNIHSVAFPGGEIRGQLDIP
jgi:predicted small lipoprotein YifL